MDQSQSDPAECETQAQVDACLQNMGVTQDQIVRWRREGLLPAVAQEPTAYAGSIVRYPTGTCAQIAAVARLFKVKNRVAFVGWQLWWEGFPVDEKFWRPLLTAKAQLFDRTIARIRAHIVRDEIHGKRLTLQERVAKSRDTNIVMSRIRGRQSGPVLATTFASIIQVAIGKFEQFSVSDDATEGNKSERAITIDAFDLEKSETDQILGHRLHLARELPNMYKLMAQGFSKGPLLQILQEPQQVIFSARDDVCNAFRIYIAHYDAMSWIYGPTAFGLRLGAWIGRKRPDFLMPLIILGFAQLRRATHELLSSEEIASLATQAEQNAQMSLAIKTIAVSDPQFRNVFSPRRIRAAFQDKTAMDKWHREVEAISAPECL